MKAIQLIFQSAILGLSLTGLGVGIATRSALAESGMPPGFTLSSTQIKGQYCYRHNNEANLYCYRSRLTSSIMKKHQESMMKKDGAMMMKKDDAMMKKGDAMMMKKDDAMMKKGDTMMKK